MNDSSGPSEPQFHSVRLCDSPHLDKRMVEPHSVTELIASNERLTRLLTDALEDNRILQRDIESLKKQRSVLVQAINMAIWRVPKSVKSVVARQLVAGMIQKFGNMSPPPAANEVVR
ncbi:hypothetical protein [Marinobacter subterrani]|uniref:hypothetical protein n=1 Tax=Marinobacter subterrani TaxID=1658765 RepID=UPI002356C690|nr:hypothetical protein [Marinobacter subterrani]